MVQTLGDMSVLDTALLGSVLFVGVAATLTVPRYCCLSPVAKSTVRGCTRHVSLQPIVEGYALKYPHRFTAEARATHVSLLWCAFEVVVGEYHPCNRAAGCSRGSFFARLRCVPPYLCPPLPLSSRFCVVFTGSNQAPGTGLL